MPEACSRNTAMPTLCLTTPGSRASLAGGRLRIEPPDGDTTAAREVPLHDIERAFVSDRCSLSTAGLAELLRRDIPVVFTSWGERVIGLCQPPAPHCVARIAQYRASLDPSLALALAIPFVEAKILNSRRVLQRLAANRPEAETDGVLKSLERMAAACLRAANLDTLRGHEGAASAAYFEAYGSFFPALAPFERRSRRPPHNAANAILSYAYTLLAAEAECQLHAIGLDPAIGFLHEPADRRASLALDLIEPFRAPVADAMALDLLSHGTLKPDAHFEKCDGGIHLNTEGKKRFFVAYERRLEREFTGPRNGRRSTLRNELHDSALAFKKALLDDEPFQPFLMH
jgi:CRISPR-associated protein Cas1